MRNVEEPDEIAPVVPLFRPNRRVRTHLVNKVPGCGTVALTIDMDCADMEPNVREKLIETFVAFVHMKQLLKDA